MNVTLIGSGNVATVLGKLIKSAGHTIMEVHSRDLLHAAILAEELGANAVDDLGRLSLDAGLFIISVSDGAIAGIAETLKLPGKMVVHTSGAVAANALQNISDNYGVLYPLQSLRKEANHIPAIPLLVDGSNEKTTKEILSFAETISNRVLFCGDEERLKLHVVAVVVSNFTNHLYALTSDYCSTEHIDFSALFPLIEEVAVRVKEYNPENMQTGPAIRGDAATIEKHIQLLAAYPQLQKIYAGMTISISEFYGNK